MLYKIEIHELLESTTQSNYPKENTVYAQIMVDIDVPNIVVFLNNQELNK